MAKLFDIPAEWRKRGANVKAASLPGGHFFPDLMRGKPLRPSLDFCGRWDERDLRGGPRPLAAPGALLFALCAHVSHASEDGV